VAASKRTSVSAYGADIRTAPGNSPSAHWPSGFEDGTLSHAPGVPVTLSDH
jgi:hypothetical protein